MKNSFLNFFCGGKAASRKQHEPRFLHLCKDCRDGALYNPVILFNRTEFPVQTPYSLTFNSLLK
jgi:hypothetical protein